MQYYQAKFKSAIWSGIIRKTKIIIFLITNWRFLKHNLLTSVFQPLSQQLFLLLNFHVLLTFTHEYFHHYSFLNIRVHIQIRGLKLKSTQGPHEHEKIFCRLQMKEKSAIRAAVYRRMLWRPHSILSNMIIFLHLITFQR